MFISHVSFNNCSFQDTEFTNVKTSRTQFKFSSLEDVGLIDTDLTERHFVDCTMNNITTLRLVSTCDRDFEYNIYLDSLWKSHFGALLPGIIFMLMVGEGSHRFGRSRSATLCFGFSISLAITFAFLHHEPQVIWTAGCAQALALAGIAALTLLAIESYTTSLRCTAVGFFVCGGHIGALLGALLYAAFPVTSSKVAAIVSTIFLSFPISSAIILKDPCLLFAVERIDNPSRVMNKIRFAFQPAPVPRHFPAGNHPASELSLCERHKSERGNMVQRPLKFHTGTSTNQPVKTGPLPPL
ncbi:hypothetical protein pipiens_017409 [Culex pipiens pipiens]|uniref:Uncharacterized protein n=1 Tax=Culex pipiens pipiens TaxID=38569 RepID=A0ABD1CGQ9_CULPP